MQKGAFRTSLNAARSVADLASRNETGHQMVSGLCTTRYAPAAGSLARFPLNPAEIALSIAANASQKCRLNRAVNVAFR